MKQLVHYLTVHGSHAYGLNGPNSDLDLRGFFFQKPEDFFGLKGGPDQEEANVFNDQGKIVRDVTVWEFRKFLKLASGSNPNILETLFTADLDVKISGNPSETLRKHAKDWFLSRQVEKTFGGYAHQQMVRLGKNLEKWDDAGVRKDAMHCVRLIYFMKEMLGTGNLTVRFDADKHPEKVNFMLAIRRGDVKVLPVYNWCLEEIAAARELVKDSPLPETPNHEAIEQFTFETLKRMYGTNP